MVIVMKGSRLVALVWLMSIYVGTLAQDKYVFDYTGQVDTFIIPDNACRIVVKVWGAGGGGGGADACGSGGPGGGGAYVEATLSSITPGTIWEIYVGGGGGAGASGGGVPGGVGGWGFGNGGNGGASGGINTSGSGGGGGGASAIVQNGVPLLVAGGGGGGGGAGLNTPCAGAGGAAGNPGENGGAGCTSLPGQAGASISVNGTNGGSVGITDDGGGGGGGGGGYDGSGGGGTGGGAAPADCGGAGGGGGASFGPTIIAGLGQTPGNAGDTDLCSGCAAGGNPGQQGGNGRIVIYVYKNPVITLDSTVKSLCDTPTGKIFITVDSAIQPYGYTWFTISGSLVDTTEDLNGVFPGDYVIIVQDSLGCSSVDTFTVLGTDSGTYEPGVPDSIILCTKVRDTILIAPSGGAAPYTVTYSPSIPNYLTCINSNCDTISVYSDFRDTTMYYFTITDNVGCKVYDSMKVIIYRPRVSLIPDLPWACWRYGDTVSAQVSGIVIGDTSYSWNIPAGAVWNTISQDGDSIVIMGLPPVDTFMFSVTVSDDYCDTTVLGYFTTRYLFSDARILDRTVCRDKETMAWPWPLLGDTPFVYTWNITNVPWNCNNSTCDTVTVTVSDTAYMQLIVKSAVYGCADTIDTTVIPLNYPVFFARPNTVYPCHGEDSIYVDVQVFYSNGPYSVGWSPLVPECFNESCDKFVFGPPFPDPVTVYVEVVDSEGCRTLDSFTIIPDYIHVDAQDLYGCRNKFDIARATVTGNVGSYFLTWYPPQFFECNTCNETKVKLLDSARAVVVAVDSIGCMAFDTFNIIVWDNPDFYLPEDTTVIRNSVIEFSLPPQYDYNWQPTTYVECPTCPTTEVAVYEDYQRYYVTAYNEYGCYVAKMIEIRSIEVHCDSADFFVPNIFSPNGDGINDILYVYGNADALVETFMVWDRWGKLLFKMESVPISINTLHSEQGWDGSSAGDLQRPDVYSYYAKIRCPSGTTFELRGDVTLMR